MNVSQLNAAVAAGETHYYSVNDGGTQGGNFANDGATALNAIAAGVGAAASGAGSVVMGSGASDNGNANATVLGGGASIAAGVAGSNVALGQGSSVRDESGRRCRERDSVRRLEAHGTRRERHDRIAGCDGRFE
ncbi:hypothetical protein [Caballeronia sp. BR00000012568055]|uniref:hypothetical protein n=1 Tax=Caballeronia sp. BR00000012568055 TaxID=2918761 RepID=UPI0023FA327F